MIVGAVLAISGCHGTAEAPAAKTAGAPSTATPLASSAEPPVILAREIYDAAPEPTVAVAPAPSGAAPAAPRARLPGSKPAGAGPGKRYVVAAIGDSLTDTRVGGGRYLRYLAERCPESQFDSHGKGGDMVNQMRRRFEREVLQPELDPPSYTDVIVFGGVNDLYSDLTAGRTVSKIEADLTAMYRAARARGLRVIAITVAPWGGFRKHYTAARAATTAELNRWILAQPAGHVVDRAIDSYPLLACGEKLCTDYASPFRDGLHFGPKGHERLASALFEQAFSDCR